MCIKSNTEALNELKCLISSAPLMLYFDAKKPSTVFVDFSDYASGALFHSEQKENLKPVVYFSRSPLPVECNNDIYDS